MQSMLQSREQWTKYTTQLDLIQHQSSVISRRLEQSTHHMQVAEVEQLKNDIGKLNLSNHGFVRC